MPGRGPTPKDPEKRQRRNAASEVTVAGKPVPAPKLQQASWLPETKRWWRAWLEAPQSATFLSTDWSRLSMVSRLVDVYYREPKASVMAEIRLCEAGLGATLVDRARLHLNVSPDAPPTSPEDATRRADPRKLRAVSPIKGEPA